MRIADGGSPHVDLVDNGLVPRYSWGAILSPSEGWVDYDAFRDTLSVVAIVTREVCSRITHCVAKHRIAPLNGPGDGLGIGIEKELGRIEAVAGLRFIGAVNPEAVELARSNLRQIDVPD